MNISPVSFGRTIKINNAGYGVAEHVADLVNRNRPQKGEERVQQQLKTLFYDSKVGKARALEVSSCEEGNGDYIVTGNASNIINKILEPFDFLIDEIRSRHDGEYSKEEDYAMNYYSRFEDDVNQVIADTKENVAINIDYDYDQQKIKSIKLVV